MTIKYLKKGKNDSDKALEDASVSETVKKTLRFSLKSLQNERF